MTAPDATVLDRLARYHLVPVVVLDDAAHADGLAASLAAGGLPVAEITFRTAAAEESIRVMAARGDVLVGAGTVLTIEQVDRAVAAGAGFVVSPGLSRAVVERCGEHGVPVLPGVVTATEIQAALELGVSTVKFFPAGTSGGGKGDCGAGGAVRRRAIRADGWSRPGELGRVPCAAFGPRGGWFVDGAPRRDRGRQLDGRA